MKITTQTHTGSVVGGMLLMTGSCIGAGMLGLPILTGLAGFFPSLLMFVLACFFMTATAFLLVESQQWYKGRVNFITMVTDILGPGGRVLCWVLYLFLFYALLVAYIAASGNHLASLTGDKIPPWVGSFFFVMLFGSLAYFGTRTVDVTNRFLMVIKLGVFLALLSLSIGYVEPAKLERMVPRYAFFPLPILIISFGFQNMIPTLTDYLGGDVKRIKRAILSGALLILTIYLFWMVIAVGILPVEGKDGILHSYFAGIDAAQALKEYLHQPWISSFAFLLAFVAILTSFLAQTLTLVHFLSDGLNIHHKKRENPWICLLTLIPPLVFAVFFPWIFYKAIGFAGGVCAVVLFGILPILMVWRGRYSFEKHHDAPYQVIGGRQLLFILLLMASFIVVYQLGQMAGVDFFPKPTPS